MTSEDVLEAKLSSLVAEWETINDLIGRIHRDPRHLNSDSSEHKAAIALRVKVEKRIWAIKEKGEVPV